MPDTATAHTRSSPLVASTYEATPAFRAVAYHAAVAYADDAGLVATTGPAEDEEAWAYARLFAAAPDLLSACRHALDLAAFAYVHATEADAALTLGEIAATLQSAVDKAAGESR